MENMRRESSRDVRRLTKSPRSASVLAESSSSSAEADVKALEDRITKMVDARLEITLQRILNAMENKIERQTPLQEWFSINETATLTGLSPDHVRRHVTSGSLAASNQGTFDKPYYRIRRRDIDAWMEKRRETPLPATRKKGSPGSYDSRHHRA